MGERPRHAAARPLGRIARCAVLGVLVWVGAYRLELPDAIGFSPDHAFFGAALLGGLLGALSAERILQGAAALIAFLLVAVTTLPIAGTLAPRLVRRDRPAADSGAAVDAIAVLSASVSEDGLVQGQTIDRLLDGIQLAQHTGRPLVVSVVRTTRGPGVPSLADQQRIAALTGVGDRLFVVDSVHTTHDEAVRMTALARAHGWHRVALVTSPAHTRRACATFERAGLAVVCTPARARDVAWSGPAPFRSAEDRLRATGMWLHETIGWIVYRARGWV